MSTPEGRRGSSHCPAEARLMAYPHYRQLTGGSDVVAVNDVVPTMPRLLGISQQPEVLDFVLSTMPSNSTIDFVGLGEFMKDVRGATRPPRWRERKDWKWANVREIAGTYLRLARKWNTDEALAAVDQTVSAGTPPVDAVAPLFHGRPFNGREAAFHAFSSLSLLDFERKPKPWESRLAEEVIICAAARGFSIDVADRRKLSSALEASDHAARGSMRHARPEGRYSLPIGLEDAWTAFGAGGLEAPEAVTAVNLPLSQIVALAIGELALENSVSRARWHSRETVPSRGITHPDALGAVSGNACSHANSGARLNFGSALYSAAREAVVGMFVHSAFPLATYKAEGDALILFPAQIFALFT